MSWEHYCAVHEAVTPKLSIIVASDGRDTLTRTIDSVKTWLYEGDELLVALQHDAPWGHRARNQMMPAARGDFLLFMDDDDVYVPGALVDVRNYCQKGWHGDFDRVHIFKMRYADGRDLWQDQEVRCGNVSTQMVVVPNLWREVSHSESDLLPQWGDRYEGDFDFIFEAVDYLGEPVWHDKVIALVRP